MKPTGLAGSRGVIRCDDADAYDAAVARIRAFWTGPLIVERYVPGGEVAVEAILRAGELTTLAVFDKPDPLVGPFFEETIYVTPSRLAPGGARRRRAARRARRGRDRAHRGSGARRGPRRRHGRPAARSCSIEVAARTIGGLCARTLQFGAGIALEEVVLRHALGMDLGDLARPPGAAGVMMLPIPRAGVLQRGRRTRRRARGARASSGSRSPCPRARAVVPLPESDRYLGFLFARADTPDAVETALRAGAAALDIVIT